nr:hypothetical protein [uncultured Hyphomonas sp.]
MFTGYKLHLALKLAIIVFLLAEFSPAIMQYEVPYAISSLFSAPEKIRLQSQDYYQVIQDQRTIRPHITGTDLVLESKTNDIVLLHHIRRGKPPLSEQIELPGTAYCHGKTCTTDPEGVGGDIICMLVILGVCLRAWLKLNRLNRKSQKPAPLWTNRPF